MDLYNTAHVIITVEQEPLLLRRLVHLVLVSPLPMLPCSRYWMFLSVRHCNPRGITNRCGPPPPPSTCHSLHNITVTEPAGFNVGVLMIVRTGDVLDVFTSVCRLSACFSGFRCLFFTTLNRLLHQSIDYLCSLLQGRHPASSVTHT